MQNLSSNSTKVSQTKSKSGALANAFAIGLRIAAVVLLAGVVPVLANLFLSRASVTPLRQEALHEAIELAGSCIALGVAMLLLLRVGYERKQTYFLWVASALIGMGLVDAVHAVVPFGVAWSWLRHVSTLVGGVTFGLIWLPLPETAATRKRFIVLAVVFCAAASSGVMWWRPDLMPAPWAHGDYSVSVKVANALGGMGFLAACVFFLRCYALTRRTENLVFASHTLLFAAGGLLFGFTHTWAPDWWVWHVMRLIAYSVVLIAAYETILGLYRNMAEQARLLEARVNERAAALKRSEEQFRLASEATTEVIWDWDLVADRIEWNGAVAAQFGEPAEMLGHEMSAFVARVHPDDQEHIVRSLREAIDSRNERWTGEYRMRRKDGSYGVFVDRAVIARDTSGKAYRVVGSMADITQERQARESQEATSDLLSGIIEGTTDMVAAIDPDFRLIAFNRAFRDKSVQIFGVNLQIGMNLLDAMSSMPVDREHAEELWSRALDGEIFIAEAEFGDPTRIRQTFELSFGPIGDRHGRLIGAAHISRNVTEYRQMEKALRDSEQRFRIMGDTLPYGVWRCGADGVLEYVSQSLLDLLEMTFEQVRDGDWLVRIRPDERVDALARWQRFIAGEQEWDREYHVLGPDGNYHAVLMRGQPVRDASGKIEGWVGINLDIDLRDRQQEALRQLQAQAEQARQLAEQANRAKDHFLAVLSHELRTPLTPVLTTLGMMQEQHLALSQEASEDLEMIRRNVEMEARLIDDLLDVTRIARGKVELDRRPVELCQVVRQAAAVCRPDIEAKKLDFAIEPCPAAPYIVSVDSARLQQVFWNLIKNAIKFTPSGGRIAVRLRRDGSSVVVDVTDSGSGIEPQVLPRIFNAFEQGGVSITRQFGGLGLGLSISKGLVEMHGGSVEALSEGKDKGATFRVRLPLAEAATAPKTAGADQAKAPPKPLRILLVEDHADTARTMVRLLAMQGHKAQAARDVASAVAYATTNDMDLLISDLGLPDGSGIDVLQQIRRSGSQVPAIALSGYGQEEDLRRSAEAGFAAHLIKPISAAKLAETIARVVSKQ